MPGSPEAVAIHEPQDHPVPEAVTTPLGRSGDKLVGLVGAEIAAGFADFRLSAGRGRSLHSSNPLI